MTYDEVYEIMKKQKGSCSGIDCDQCPGDGGPVTCFGLPAGRTDRTVRLEACRAMTTKHLLEKI